jgi:hypothetical protein
MTHDKQAPDDLTIDPAVLRSMDKAIANLNAGIVGPAIDLSRYNELLEEGD